MADRLLQEKGYISVVELLLAMGRLSKQDYERWRFRKVPHLEAVLPDHCELSTSGTKLAEKVPWSPPSQLPLIL